MNGARRPKPPSGTHQRPSDRSVARPMTFRHGSSAGTGKAVPLLLCPAAVSTRILAMSPLARASTLLNSYGRSFQAIGLAAFHSTMPFGFLATFCLPRPGGFGSVVACRSPLDASPALATERLEVSLWRAPPSVSREERRWSSPTGQSCSPSRTYGCLGGNHDKPE